MYESKSYSHFSKATDYWPWKNFLPPEIACKGTGRLLVHHKSMDALQLFRTIHGGPVVINSAYRSPEHNAKVGGAKNSYHVKGQAFDIRITPTLSRERIKAVAEKAGFKGIIDYNTFVHIDTRATPYRGDARK